jgi:hypothetical protein
MFNLIPLCFFLKFVRFFLIFFFYNKNFKKNVSQIKKQKKKKKKKKGAAKEQYSFELQQLSVRCFLVKMNVLPKNVIVSLFQKVFKYEEPYTLRSILRLCSSGFELTYYSSRPSRISRRPALNPRHLSSLVDFCWSRYEFRLKLLTRWIKVLNSRIWGSHSGE